jgi:hypothetical protein
MRVGDFGSTLESLPVLLHDNAHRLIITYARSLFRRRNGTYRQAARLLVHTQYLKHILSLFLTSCQFLSLTLPRACTHTHHTHAHTHTQRHSHNRTPLLLRLCPISNSGHLYLSHSVIHSLTLSLSLPHAYSLTPLISLSPTHTHTHLSFSLSLTHTHKHTNTQVLELLTFRGIE